MTEALTRSWAFLSSFVVFVHISTHPRIDSITLKGLADFGAVGRDTQNLVFLKEALVGLPQIFQGHYRQL